MAVFKLGGLFFLHQGGKIMLEKKLEHWENGKLKAVWYEDELGRKQGESLQYKKTGELFIKSEYKNGELEGDYIVYHENGRVSREETYKAGMVEGLSKKYFDNGVLEEIGEYKKGQREGEWRVNHSNGEVKEISLFYVVVEMFIL